MAKRYVSPQTLLPVVAHANYFNVRPEQTWGPRSIYDIELILVIAGQFCFDLPERSWPVQAGEVLLIEPGREHTFHCLPSQGEARISCIHFEPVRGMHWADGELRFAVAPETVTPVAPVRLVHDLFRSVSGAFNSPGSAGRDIASSLVRAIWLRLTELWQRQDAPGKSRRISAMLDYLTAHMHEPVSRRDLARQFDLTPQYVNALFRQELGTTPTAWLNAARCRRAETLMRAEGLNVSQAAVAVGFSEPGYFSRIYRRVMGTPPSRAGG